MIKLEDNWVIDNDIYGYVVGHFDRMAFDKKSGKDRPVYSKQRYYSTLKQAVEGYYKLREKEMFAEGTFTLEEAIRALNALYERIDEDLKKALRDHVEVDIGDVDN